MHKEASKPINCEQVDKVKPTAHLVSRVAAGRFGTALADTLNTPAKKGRWYFLTKF